MHDTIERQRRLAQEKLAARRRKREEQQYEEDMAVSIVTMAEQQFALIREKTMLRRGEQKDTVCWTNHLLHYSTSRHIIALGSSVLAINISYHRPIRNMAATK